ncbi:DsbA family protein [Buchananella hordeovulneris]|uniref:DsbA family protein n=1 Tax=Buchananella hordeovulneris TaxID=52770 RepID=A0A1Q5PX87_9ACTO|nr:DsbA family protein [Buchananella hordeovulneris]OKL52116.1 hypothetical protein BSZ40_04215 [Buchananella hordeovulneris]
MLVSITVFTDPVCTWCWGSEPMLRAVAERYGAQVEIRQVMGGLVPDIRSFRDDANGIGGDPEQANLDVAAHYAAAAGRHQMPVTPTGLRLFDAEHVSTHPQGIAYHAARQQGDELAERFLRRMREAGAAEARQTNRPEVLVELAAEAGLDVGRFLAALEDGTAADAFATDLRLVAETGVRGFPAFLFTVPGKHPVLLPAWQPYGTFRQVIGFLTGQRAVEAQLEPTVERVAEFVRRWRSVADVEVQTAFELSDDAWSTLAPQVLADPRIVEMPAESGRFLRWQEPSGACAVAGSGVCGV